MLGTDVSCKSIQIYQTKYKAEQKHRFLLILTYSSTSLQVYYFNIALFDTIVFQQCCTAMVGVCVIKTDKCHVQGKTNITDKTEKLK